MLALAKVREVERLLAEGELSQRKIAKATGVSRATISGIASGRRPDYELRMRARADKEVVEPLGPIERCPTCGGRVYMPCRLCRVRKVKVPEERRLRAMRRRAYEQAIKRLISAVRKANQPHESDVASYLSDPSASSGP